MEKNTGINVSVTKRQSKRSFRWIPSIFATNGIEYAYLEMFAREFYIRLPPPGDLPRYEEVRSFLKTAEEVRMPVIYYRASGLRENMAENEVHFSNGRHTTEAVALSGDEQTRIFVMVPERDVEVVCRWLKINECPDAKIHYILPENTQSD